MAGAFSYITMLYMALLGIPNLAAVPALRLAAFSLVVPGTYVATFLASRTRDGRPRSEVQSLAYASMTAALLTALWGSAEISAYFGRRGRAGFRRGANLQGVDPIRALPLKARQTMIPPVHSLNGVTEFSPTS